VSDLDDPMLLPIAGPSPVGRDLTYENHVVELDAEVQKNTSLAGLTTDWAKVRTESARILREESKDLRIASWWVVAVAYADGWAPAADALAIYAELADRYWADMYPPLKRLRGRGALLGWIWETLAKAISGRTPTLADKEGILAFEATMTRLDATMSERLGDAAPGVGPLRSVVREKVRLIPEPAAAPAPQATAAAGGAPGPSAIAAPEAVTATNLDEAEAAATRYREALSSLAHVARRTAPTAPWPYRLARVSAWLTIEGAPPVEQGKTFVRAPPAAERSTLAALFETGAWEGLREASEDALSEHLFWLDIHRYTALALERLGPTFAAARAAVRRETTALLLRIPTLPTLLFSDGTPFASPATADWLADELRAAGGADAGAGGGGGGGDSDEAAALIAQCEAGIAAGQIEAALGAALAAAHGAPSARGRFQGRLGVAQLAQRSGKTRFALAILEGLLAEVNPTLESWEPKLCGSLFEALLKAVRAVAPQDEDRQEALFRRLLAADPAAAIRMEP
jgi:type VI secretion system protein VasJ